MTKSDDDQQASVRTVQEMVARRVSLLLSEEAPEGMDPNVLRVIRVAALSYSARYLRSIMADRAANLLEARALDLDLEGLDLEDDEAFAGHTMVGLGVRPVPSASHSFE